MAAMAVVPEPMKGSSTMMGSSVVLMQWRILSGSVSGYGAGCLVLISKGNSHTSFLKGVSGFLSNIGLVDLVSQKMSSVVGRYLLLQTLLVDFLSQMISCLILKLVLNSH